MDNLSFPTWLDNTALTDFKSCEKKGYWSTFRLLEQKPPSVDLHAGAAFARALEAARLAYYTQNRSAELAVFDGIRALWTAWGDYETPEGSYKNWLTLTYALLYYFSVWPLDNDYIEPVLAGTSPAIEFSFSIPLGINHPETGEPILYTGRADMFGKYRDTYWNLDDKTTKGIGPRWAQQWSLRGQFLGYTWAAREFGFPVKGTIVRCVSIQVKDNKSAECIQPYSDHLIDEWQRSVLRTIQDMIDAWKDGYFRSDFGHGCNSYSGCPFKQLCESPEPERWLMYYQHRTWDPLH